MKPEIAKGSRVRNPIDGRTGKVVDVYEGRPFAGHTTMVDVQMDNGELHTYYRDLSGLVCLDTTFVTVRLPAAVAAWIANGELGLVEPHHGPEEREWRQALAAIDVEADDVELELSTASARALEDVLATWAEFLPP